MRKGSKNSIKTIVLEELTHLRKRTGRGDGSGKKTRFRMHNSFPYANVQNMIRYKAAWDGVPVILLTKDETVGTSSQCSYAGIRSRGTLWTETCGAQTIRS